MRLQVVLWLLWLGVLERDAWLPKEKRTLGSWGFFFLCRNFDAVNIQIDVVQNEGGDVDLLVCSGLALLLGLSQFREALSEFVVSSLARPTLSQLQ